MADPPAAGRRRIVSVGEPMIELREEPGGGLSYGFAGDTLNVATYLRRLLPVPQFSVDYLTAVGDDPLSGRMVDGWQREGLGTRLVLRMEGLLPGLYWIGRRPDGEREFYYWRSASAARQLFSKQSPLVGEPPASLAGMLGPGDLLYLSAISVAILPQDGRERLLGLMRELRGNGVSIAYDGNYRPRLWQSAEEAKEVYGLVLAYVDIYITSFPDEAELFGDASVEQTAARLEAHQVADWVVRGEPGVAFIRTGDPAYCEPVAPSAVVDTTGAGDSFDAAYLSARLLGLSGTEAVRAGHALAGIVVQHRGAIVAPEDTPSLEDLIRR